MRNMVEGSDTPSRLQRAISPWSRNAKDDLGGSRLTGQGKIKAFLHDPRHDMILSGSLKIESVSNMQANQQTAGPAGLPHAFLFIFAFTKLNKIRDSPP
ncbi:hypothetical protein [Parasphingorhabdus sp.]|uniref:hypothetical protein n=1 Tax=Parasphingorhabdus sp. TaxID=2709688 RepID=UPI003D26A0EC